MTKFLTKSTVWIAEDRDDAPLLKLQHCLDFDLGDSAGVETVKGLGKNLGTVRTEGGFPISLSIADVARPEVDWYALADSDATFRLEVQKRGGYRLQYRNCRVGPITNAEDNDGKPTFKVAIEASKRKSIS